MLEAFGLPVSRVDHDARDHTLLMANLKLDSTLLQAVFVNQTNQLRFGIYNDGASELNNNEQVKSMKLLRVEHPIDSSWGTQKFTAQLRVIPTEVGRSFGGTIPATVPPPLLGYYGLPSDFNDAAVNSGLITDVSLNVRAREQEWLLGWSANHSLGVHNLSGGVELLHREIDDVAYQQWVNETNLGWSNGGWLYDGIESDHVSIYLQDEWELGERLHLTYGARHDNISDSENMSSPRASLVWRKDDNWIYKTQYAESYRAPVNAGAIASLFAAPLYS
ncbi:MAG: TonB-dependent receptor [Candidatus Marinimicrobia bacterium]|jgi:outer membrane receptor protein involved in Fe transport|nr:TonB-dependent receptor [Candidatus Neomarinimicrobiota bacterium]